MTRIHPAAQTVIAVLLSGTMWLLSSGINHVWILAWFAPVPLLPVGLAANDIETARRLEQGGPGEPLHVLRAFAKRADMLASGGARIVVLPEKFVAVTPEYAEAARAILSATARERQITIVAGWYVVTPPERRNVAVVFGPNGDVILEYDKQHLVRELNGATARGTPSVF